MTRCTSVQERLADEGVTLIGRDAAIREHVAGCPSCGPFLEALEKVDAGISRLAPVPASGTLLARTAKAVGREANSPTSGRARDPGARKLAAALAAMVILVAGFGLVETVQQELARMDRLFAGQSAGRFYGERYRLRDEGRPAVVAPKVSAPTQELPQSVVAEPLPEALPESIVEREQPEPLALFMPAPVARARTEAVEPPVDVSSMPALSAAAPAAVAPAEEMLRSAPSAQWHSNGGYASADQLSKEQNKRDGQKAGEARRKYNVGGTAGLEGQRYGSFNEAQPPADSSSSYELPSSMPYPRAAAKPEEDILMPGSPARTHSNQRSASVAQPSEEQKKRDRQLAGKAKRKKSAGGDDARLRGNRMLGETVARGLAADRIEAESPAWPHVVPEIPAAGTSFADGRDDAARLPMSTMSAMPAKSGRVADAKDKLEKNVQTTAGSVLAQSTGPRQVARRFLAEGERLTGLDFQSGSGYWANTYVPGDPAIRLLEARLQRWDRSALVASLGDSRLEAAARQNWQPFDVPENAALAAYLHADKRAINGRSRLRIQVGLQASLKRSGLRPDMNVGVVLDLRRPVDDATGAKLRALVAALARARQPGDRFSITVAGHPGGLLVAPEDFRYGPIRVAMQSLFTTTGKTRAPAMDLAAAVQTASQSVRQGDDPSAPLGASLVLLVSTAPFTKQRESLERMAHENAVAGIGMSVVAVGGRADLVSIDRLALLGQGHRRVLAAAEDAVTLVDRELHAASRAVARAVRLRIRLAPGVELIDVLGSKNLSDQAAQRVREAERSIDQRMARNIGIRADRGEDEEGIQIVIPSFFAGDSHALLLDVVVPGPGPVADISVRYKDLVYRRNGVARALLTIEDGHRDPGPLERNVLKNQLAYALASSATAAGQQLAAGDRRAAVRTLTTARELISGMRQEIPGRDNDYELRGDEALLVQYLTVLGSRFAGTGQQQRHLADSLHYLAFRRLIPTHK